MLLARVRDGDASARDELLPLIYDELKRLANALTGQAAGSTLNATALVHELYVRLSAQEGDGNEWNDRAHFLAVASRAMRNLLIDYARAKKRDKRGGGEWKRVTVDPASESVEVSNYDLIDLSAALESLSAFDERVGRVVELRFLGGLTVEEVAAEVGVSDRQVRRDWRVGRAYLKEQLWDGD